MSISADKLDITGENVAGRDINIYTYEDDLSSSCPYCGVEPEGNLANDEVTCNGCGNTYYEYIVPSNTTTKFKNVPPELNYNYSNIIQLVTARIKLKQYDEAIAKCEEAVNLCSRTPQGWEYRAFCHYIVTKKEEIINNRASTLLDYLRIAEETDPTSKSLQKTRKVISHKLFHVLRKRIEFHRSTDNSENSKNKWISHYILCWNICYNIYPDAFFLKEIVLHFYGHRKENWYDYSFSNLENKFVLHHKIKSFSGDDSSINKTISKIKRSDSLYQAPVKKGGLFQGNPKLDLKDLLKLRNKERNDILTQENEARQRVLAEAKVIQERKSREEKNKRNLRVASVAIGLPLGTFLIYAFWKVLVGALFIFAVGSGLIYFKNRNS